MKPTLNIVGCGKVGQVLGRLWAGKETFLVQDVLNRSFETAREATVFMDAGTPVEDSGSLRPADVILIGTPDDHIETVCERLAGAGHFRAGCVVFHCSGALTSSALRSAARHGASIASVHPIRSFAGPEKVAASFAGTFCGIEGDEVALCVLRDAFAAIGARLVPIDPAFKTVYHAAAVFASNYVVTLLDTAVAAYAKAGIPENVALQLMEPLVQGTVDNVFRVGTADALTGPIARGDLATVVRQYRAVRGWDRQRGALYKVLGKLTAEVAAKKKL